MTALVEFREILEENAPLAQWTSLKVGGPAQWLASPRDIDELGRLVRRCRDASIPYYVLGGGSNVLAPDDPLHGVVINTTAPAFRQMSMDGTRLRCGAGASLADLITFACKASASGLESLAGIPGAVGGALRCNAGSRAGDIGQHVVAIDVMDQEGVVSVLSRSDVRFGYRQSNLDDVIVLNGVFDLVEDNPDDIVRRVKKNWITKKASQPFGFQSAGYVFRNPRGLRWADLIERADLRGARVGGAELCDRDPRFIVTQTGASSRDVLRLIDLVRAKVDEHTGVQMELHIAVW